MGLFDWNTTDDEDEAPKVALFEFESGTLCPVCGKYHADQWWCDPEIPNPWGASKEDEE